MPMPEIVLDHQQFLEFEKIAVGAFRPLAGFMNQAQFDGVVRDMRLPGGAPFTLPVLLPLPRDTAWSVRGRPSVPLVYRGEEVGSLQPEDVFRVDLRAAAPALFGTADARHPGAAWFQAQPEWCVGGPVAIRPGVAKRLSGDTHTPAETRALWQDRAWTRIAGFQTRNVPHRAHEYLIRCALELTDGVMVQPLVGRKQAGDYTPAAILAGYRELIGAFLPADRVVLSVLSTWMRYAGPREAILHAIIRRNYGCSHFIVGRDHAGVGGYYGRYDAHALARRFEGELGIEIMRFHGPFHCGQCGGIATERSCAHVHGDPASVQEISGTMIRAMLRREVVPQPEFIRPEVVAAIQAVSPLFTGEA
jgi:sulfate adenylyltransferase